MVPQVGSNYVCGLLKLGTTQDDVKSFIFVPSKNIYKEIDGYVRMIDSTHFLQIIQGQNNQTLFTVFQVDDFNGITQVATYQSPTNCFSDCWVYSLKNNYILSGLNYIYSCDNTNYTITPSFQASNNPYVEVLVCKYKYQLNYYYEYFKFIKNSQTGYSLMKIKDSHILFNQSNIVYTINNPQLNNQPITESNVDYITAFNEKNLYCYKSQTSGKYYIQVERFDPINRTDNFRTLKFCDLSRRYEYDIIVYDDNGNFNTIYSSDENNIYYILQYDYEGTIYLVNIQVNQDNYVITYTDIESGNQFGSVTVQRPSNYKLIAVTNVRNEIVILEVTDIVHDYENGINVLVTDIHYNTQTQQIETNQSPLAVNLFCTLRADSVDTIGTDIKGISFLDTQLSFAVYCGSNRYDANYVIVSIPEKDIFVVDSKREPFTFSFINHSMTYYEAGYVKTGLMKSYYPLLLPQTSVIFETTTNVNDINRFSYYFTNAYFSKYRQSLKRVNDDVYIGDLSIGYNPINSTYVFPLQEGTDILDQQSGFNNYIQSYTVSYSPEITSVIRYLKYATRNPAVISLSNLFSLENQIPRLQTIPLFVAKTTYDLIYIIGVDIDIGGGEYVDITQKTYAQACANISSLSKGYSIYTTSSELLQNGILNKIDIKQFLSNGNPIFDDPSEFFGLFSTNNGELVVLKQTNPNAGIPISYGDDSHCSYYYTFDIYIGYSHTNLKLFGSINYASRTPLIPYQYDSKNNLITYTTPIIFEINNTLYLYLFQNIIDLSKVLWYTFDEIYGSFEYISSSTLINNIQNDSEITVFEQTTPGNYSIQLDLSNVDPRMYINFEVAGAQSGNSGNNPGELGEIVNLKMLVTDLLDIEKPTGDEISLYIVVGGQNQSSNGSSGSEGASMVAVNNWPYNGGIILAKAGGVGKSYCIETCYQCSFSDWANSDGSQGNGYVKIYLTYG